jgi:hypothetical protein
MLSLSLTFRLTVPGDAVSWEENWCRIQPETKQSKREEREETHEASEQVPFVLVCRDSLPLNSRTYAPLEDEPGLFRTFADLEPTREALLKFARRYGILGLGRGRYGHHVLLAKLSAEGSLPGETREEWEEEVRRVREAVQLLDATRSSDPTRLMELMTWQESSRRPSGAASGWVYRGPRGKKEPIGLYSADEGALAALEQVATWAKDGMARPITLGLSRDEQRGFKLSSRGQNLLMAIWLQVALQVIEPTEFKRCRDCDRYFVVGNDARKSSQEFCQEACKSREYRRRWRLGVRLAKAGKSAAEIAAEVNTDISTVRRWLKAPGEAKD